MTEPDPVEALHQAAQHLRRLGRRFALVGGLAVSVRGEVRFTRDVDLALGVADDTDLQSLVFALRDAGYVAHVLVEHEERKRIATVRLGSPAGITVDLLAASCGIEPEIVERSTPVALAGRLVPVARAEELLAMKVLSATERRLQDTIDARSLVASNPGLDLAAVRADLDLIRVRGYDRGQDLAAKLAAILAASG